jgi:translocator protein
MTPPNKPSELPSLLVWLALCLAAGWFGSHYQPGAWYAQLQKPSFNPPAWVFAPVWTALYVLMAVAAWLVWRERRRAQVYPALALFIVQLGLNAAWTWIFFGWQRPGAALLEILALWLALLATLLAFRRVRRTAGLLLWPYLLWVSFAAALNFQFWRLNP